MAEEIIPVAVCGAAGRMGREVVRAVTEAEGIQLAAAVDHHEIGRDAGEVAGVGSLGGAIEGDLESALERVRPHVLVDFTVPASVLGNARTALAHGVSPVIGTTGLTPSDLAELDRLAKEKGVGAFVAPNFAIGAVLMMQFAAQAARYLPDVEIIELHHEKKLDSPSGTALLTAQKIAQARSEATGDIPIHSVRLPGFVAHQEVLFGGPGQILTLRHDSTERRSFMPGVLLAIRKVRSLSSLVVGLEHLL